VVFFVENFSEIRGMKAPEYIILFGTVHIHLTEIKYNLFSKGTHGKLAESSALCEFGLSTARFA